MMRFDRITLGGQAKELGFVRDTFEKVCRLADILASEESKWDGHILCLECVKSCPKKVL